MAVAVPARGSGVRWAAPPPRHGQRRAARDHAERPRDAVRLRHHAVRRDPPGPRRDLRDVRRPRPHAARRRPRGPVRAERHRHRRPAAREGGARRPRLGRAGPRGDRPLRRGHDGAAGHRARPFHRRRRVDPAHRQGGRGAGGERLRIPARVPGGWARRLLRRDRAAALRRGLPSGPRRDARAVRRAGRRPRAGGEARRRSTRRCGARAERASRPGRAARWATADPAGTSSAPPSRSSISASRSTSRAAARTSSSRTTR